MGHGDLTLLYCPTVLVITELAEKVTISEFWLISEEGFSHETIQKPVFEWMGTY